MKGLDEKGEGREMGREKALEKRREKGLERRERGREKREGGKGILREES